MRCCAWLAIDIGHSHGILLAAMSDKRRSFRFREIQWWKWAIPELAAYEDEAACIEDWKLVSRQSISRRQVVGFILLVGVGMGGLMVVMDTIVVPSFPWLREYAAPMCGAVVGGLGSLAMTWLSRKRVRRRLHERLLARGIHTCIKCAYDLRGLTTGYCPECGCPFDSQEDGASRRTLH